MKYLSLASGSSGNSHLVFDENNRILIDVGKSAGYIEKALASIELKPTDIHAIVLTHEHRDHAQGLRLLNKRYGIPLYMHSKTYEVLYEEMQLQGAKVTFLDHQEDIDLGSWGLKIFHVPHDAQACLGYQVISREGKIGIATDIGHMTEEIFQALKDSDLLAIESNHDETLVQMGPYPYYLKKRILSSQGHLSNEDCGRFLCRVMQEKGKLRQVLLSHLSHKNNDPFLAKATVVSLLEEIGVKPDVDLSVDVSPRDALGPLYHLDK